jgi:hypothetical protein
VKALIYVNTATTLPRGIWRNVHVDQPRGYAYSTPTHFVHVYGRGSGLHIISPGLTVSEQRGGSLRDWVIRRFGATHIQKSVNDVGDCTGGVWRPALYADDSLQSALGFSSDEQRSAEQGLRLLVEMLDELLLYIEPDNRGLRTFGHKTRELLILACMEVENAWRGFFRLSGRRARRLTTTQYVSLHKPLFLSEFELEFRPHSQQLRLRPFGGWSASNPTISLAWYDAYNKTKHDRTHHFADASLLNCIRAVAAALIMFSVRFGPFRLDRGVGMLPSLTAPLFNFSLRRPNIRSFYIPDLDVSDRSPALTWGHADVKPWNVQAFRV